MKIKFLYKVLILLVLIFLPIFSIILIKDPCYLHKNFEDQNKCNPKEEIDRYIIPTVINTFPHETVIVGNSLASELLSKDVNSKFNTTTLNACQRGSQLYEQQNIINYELKTNKNLKKIIWVIHNSILTEENPNSIYSKKTYPWYLYTNNVLKYLYYFDIFVTSFCFNNDRTFTPQNFNYYDTSFFQKRQNNQNENFFSISKEAVFIDEIPEINDSYKRNINLNIIKTLDKIPDNIQVILIFPPVRMRYFYHFNASQILACQNYLINTLSTKSNISFTDYSIEDEISLNSDYFFDHIHYSPEIGKFMIENIDNVKYHVTNENLNIFNKKFINQSNEFNTKSENEVERF